LALKSALGGDRIDIVLIDAGSVAAAAALLSRVAGVDAEVDVEARRVSAPVSDRVDALSAVVREFGARAEDITLRRPTLDEVFLALTDEVAA
jgi:ABC-2 type transport system ATP-binding protein